ncbi:MAG TPA: hypothetical protein VIM05_07630 [Gaiellaceae bacterium]
MKTLRKRWLLLGGVFGAGVGAVVVSALAIFAGAGIAAGQAKPVNASPPTITGTPQEGKTLTGNRGSWDNTPTDYNYFWRRCNGGGNNCSGIGGANALTYTLRAGDVGSTIRFRVVAKNADGQNDADSAPTDVIQKASTPTPPPTTTTTPSRGSGCPAGGNPDQVANINAPASLILDAQTSDPSVVTAGVETLVVRYHVTSTCGGPVQGALVYATATPFNQFAIPPEVPTGADGWAELRFQRLSGFPVSSRQQLIAMFARARKPGQSILLGIAARRLFSIPVNLHG